MRLIKLSIIFLCVATLQSCFFVAGAAAGATVAIVYDQRSVDGMLEDKKLSNRIANLIIEDAELKKHANISVTSFGGIVLLSGQVSTFKLRDKAEAIANKVPGIRKFYNGISVQNRIAPLVMASDSWITTKIKTALLAKTGLQSTSIKVVTEDSTVYLLGFASQEQEKFLVDFARQIAGVKQVISIVEIVAPQLKNKQNAATHEDNTVDNEAPLVTEVPA